uniref:Uncharacterized protein n=1 Tax=Avena sativa TaxID=4498 RepID=A0ACD5WT58_AVESA
MPCCCCCFLVSSKKQASGLDSRTSVGGAGLSSDLKNIKLFSYSELRSATSNFHRSNKIGQGGFGTVYKGTLRDDGGDVAVKVLSAQSRQGSKEFLTEIDVIANVRHPNLVALVGCCAEGDHRILVYEHLRNGSLHRALLASASGSDSDNSRLTWSIRRGVCVGVARGLAFLHEDMASGPIVHRDIKASNVLLDAGYGARIGDFGLAKLFPDDATHVSTRIAGTPGYLAPEYAWHGQLTKKADVYSFGVLVLETVTGKSSSRSLVLSGGADGVLVERVWELYEAGNLREMVDPAMMMGDDDGCFTTIEKEEGEAVRYMKVALLCTQAAPLRRPSMPQVVEMLERDDVRVREKELTPPGYVVKPNSRQGSGSKSSDAMSSMLVASHTMTELAPR